MSAQSASNTVPRKERMAPVVEPTIGDRSDELKEQVYRMLKRMIMKRELTPNERIDANQVATTLNVSRTPVRDALRTLDHEGFIYTIARKGTFVKGIRRDDLIHLFQFREMVELYALELGKDTLFDSVDAMKDTVSGWDGWLAAEDYNGVQLMDSDARFHKHIVQVTGNARIIEAYDRNNCHVQMARAYYVQDAARILDAHHEHLHLITTLVERDLDGAKTALKLHLDNTLSNLLKIIEVSKVL